MCCEDVWCDVKVSLLDPQSLNCVHRLQAHTGTLSDFDVCGNQLVTCGFSNRSVSMLPILPVSVCFFAVLDSDSRGVYAPPKLLHIGISSAPKTVCRPGNLTVLTQSSWFREGPHRGVKGEGRKKGRGIEGMGGKRVEIEGKKRMEGGERKNREGMEGQTCSSCSPI